MVKFFKKKQVENFSKKSFVAPSSFSLSGNLDYLLKSSEENLILENSIASRCVHLIAKSVSEINPVFYKKSGDGKEKGLIDTQAYKSSKLLMRPNALQSWDGFIYEIAYQHLIHSRAFIFRAGSQLLEDKITTPAYLYPLKSSEVLENRKLNEFLPYEYVYGTKNYPIKEDFKNVRLISKIAKMSDRPLNDINLGASRVKSIKDNIITYNLMDGFVKSFAKGNGKGNIAIRAVDNNGMPLQMDEETLKYYKEFFLDYFTDRNETSNGLIHAGEITQIGDNEFLKHIVNLKDKAREEIALFFGVPVQMLNDKNSSTYNNVLEERNGFYTSVIIPLLKDIIDFLQREVIDLIGDEIILSYEANQIDAIKDRKMHEMERLEKISFLSINEKRKIAGEPNLEKDGDVVLVSRNLQALENTTIVLPDNFAEITQEELQNTTNGRVGE